MLDNAHLGIVVKPLDRALVLLRFGLIPLIAVCVSLPAISSALDGTAPRGGNVLIGLAGPLVAVAYLLLLQMDSVGGQVDRVVALVQRRIAAACDHDYGSTHKERGIACRLTPEIFHAPLFRYEAQTEVVSDLARACGERDSGRFWFVEGRGGSGKTRTALRLVQALIRDTQLFEYGCRCYLYDLSRYPSVQTELVRKLRRGRLAQAVVMVDNFHLVAATELQELTDLLVDRRESRPARLLVFFTRPGDAWNLGPGTDIRLLSEAKAAGCYVKLGGPQARVVEDGISKIDERASELVASLRKNGTASAAQLHLAQVIARNGSVPPDVLATIHLVLGTKGESEPSAHLVALLAVLAGLSVHRGSFSRSELRKAIRLVAQEVGDAKPLGTLQLRASFRRLRRVGLVARVNSESPRYLFHEELAELCIDQLAHSLALAAPLRETFESSLRVVAGKRLEALLAPGCAVEAWLVATEMGDQDELADRFEAALADGAMKRMLPCLRRAEKRYALTPSQRLQLAILLDRTGEFAESRVVFADDRLHEVAPSDDLALLLAASRVESNHPSGHERDLQVLLNHRDPLVNLIGEYWGLHVDTHRGRFPADAMLGVAAEALPMVEARGTFWQIHSLGRMQFDSLRAFYLSGRRDFKRLESATRRPIDAYLRKKLPNYEGMHLLYRHAHLIGHLLLPRLALLDQTVDVDAAAFAGLELGRPATVEDLAKAALYYYRRAQDEFWQVGDRESSYLKADVLNAKMIQVGADLPSLKSALSDYRDFIARGNFTTLNGYPHFYYFRWHVLQHYAQLAQGGGLTAGDEHLNEARRALGKMIACDRGSGNCYGVQRGKLLNVLLEGLDKPFNVSVLEKLMAEIDQLGYGFERDLLAKLVRQEGHASSGEMMDIFRYYPFVHQ
jgi:hypothetical protein